MNKEHHLPTSGFVRLPQILQVFPVSKSTWWSGVREGKYPPSVKLGKRVTAWKAENIHALLNTLSNDRGTHNV
jgi:prophage regulatory protein